MRLPKILVLTSKARGQRTSPKRPNTSNFKLLKLGPTHEIGLGDQESRCPPPVQPHDLP